MIRYILKNHTGRIIDVSNVLFKLSNKRTVIGIRTKSILDSPGYTSYLKSLKVKTEDGETNLNVLFSKIATHPFLYEGTHYMFPYAYTPKTGDVIIIRDMIAFAAK